MTATDKIPHDAREVYLNEQGEPIAFTPYEGLALADVPRAQLFELNRDRLAAMASRALARGLSPSDFAMVCVDVDDPAWNELVDALMPGSEAQWAAIRARGEKPVARGSAERAGILELLDRVAGAAARDVRSRNPTRESIDAIVFACGGASAFTVSPA
jgi:hypothetical protein